MTREQRLLEIFELDLRVDAQECIRLEALLDELHGKLMKRDTAAISALNERIEAHLEQLALHDARRRKVLAAFALEHDAAGIEALLGRLPGERATTMRGIWLYLSRQLQDCRRSNERNGGLMAMHHEILAQLLSESDDPLYAPQEY